MVKTKQVAIWPAEIDDDIPADFADARRRAATEVMSRQIRTVIDQAVTSFGRRGDTVGGDALRTAEQLQALIVALEAGIGTLRDAMYQQIDDAFVHEKVSLAKAAREIGLPEKSLRDSHQAWRQAHPELANAVVYRERDPKVFLTALKQWRKANPTEAFPAYSTKWPHPNNPDAELWIGEWIRNKRTALKAGKGDEAMYRRIDNAMGKRWRGDSTSGKGRPPRSRQSE